MLESKKLHPERATSAAQKLISELRTGPPTKLRPYVADAPRAQREHFSTGSAAQHGGRALRVLVSSNDLLGGCVDLHLFRLSLKEREMHDLFGPLYPPGTPQSREDWLRTTFSREWEFVHYGTPFVYQPIKDGRDELLLGWLGRERQILERTPPEEGFEPVRHAGWQAAFMAIDPTVHEDGQKLAIEYNREIGVPKAILRSFVQHINRDPTAGHYLQAYPILVQGSFWRFAEQHGNSIRSLTFDVAVPNMFGGKSDFENELKFARDELNASRIKSTLESDTVLNHQDQRIGSIIDYVEKGVGELSAEAADGTRYSSTSHEKIVNIEVEHRSQGVQRFLRDFWQKVDRVFP